MSDKISWLLLEYDKSHEKGGLVSSGVFSEAFCEWLVGRKEKSKRLEVLANNPCLYCEIYKTPGNNCQLCFNYHFFRGRRLFVPFNNE
jgi:hypothetical protein